MSEVLKLFWKHGEVREVRVLGARTPSYPGPHVESGYFKTPEDLLAAASKYNDSSWGCKGVYLTLNPVHEACYSRSPGRMSSNSGGCTHLEKMAR